MKHTPGLRAQSGELEMRTQVKKVKEKWNKGEEVATIFHSKQVPINEPPNMNAATLDSLQTLIIQNLSEQRSNMNR